VYPIAISAQIAPLDRPGEVEAQLRQIVMDHRVPGHDAGLVAVGQVGDAVVDRQRRERRDQTPAAGKTANRRERACRHRGRAGRGEIVVVSTGSI
jgi:hypothetical protein